MPQSEDVFPVVTYAEGAISDDGRAVLCKVQTIEHGQLRFGLKLGDVHDFVTFLLRLVAETDTDIGSDSPPARIVYQTIPVAAVSVGELEGENGCLGVTIGARELMFEIPTSAMPKIGQALMMASAPQTQRLV